jgi:molybdopterin-guanine dinucleotide biosynthesis protein A
VDGIGYSAVVLAGGAGRRLGGPAKPALPMAGRPMLARVLAATEAATRRVVVGPATLAPLVPAGVALTMEDPPGGGPVAALAAGLAALDGAATAGSPGEVVAVFAADLPLLSRPAVDRLLAALAPDSSAAAARIDGALYVDDDRRRQWLCGAWFLDAVRSRLDAMAVGRAQAALAGRALRELFGPLRVAEVTTPDGEPPAWYDCDTAAQLAAAERLWPH